MLTEDYLQHPVEEFNDELLYINASAMPDAYLPEALNNLLLNQGLEQNGQFIAFKTSTQLLYGFRAVDITEMEWIEYKHPLLFLTYPFQINEASQTFIGFDFELITKNRLSAPISSTNNIISPSNIFIEEGAVVEFCTINANDAYVYIGKDAMVMEGTMIRGSFAMLEKSVVKLGSKIYGTTIAGKQCTLGGEIKNTVFFDYSNKAHDGYMGDAVIGTWCNIGAGTCASNVKNTASEVKLWNPLLHKWINAGVKCGVMMGDYSRTGINTALNTGTVTGICSNIVSDGWPPKYIPHFSWNTSTGERYVLEKAIAAIENWKKMKQQYLDETEKAILQYIYNSLS
jgi:UDP-N-acetylglucosamine diphosphorylase/glucosamine-1-phosphate N-acetyltransferase